MAARRGAACWQRAELGLTDGAAGHNQQARAALGSNGALDTGVLAEAVGAAAASASGAGAGGSSGDDLAASAAGSANGSILEELDSARGHHLVGASLGDFLKAFIEESRALEQAGQGCGRQAGSVGGQ